LAAIRSIFAQSGVTRIFSKDLVAALRVLPDRPGSNPLIHPSTNPSIHLTARLVALHLAAFSIHARNIHIAGRQAKGYLLSDFTAAFSQFLAAPKLDESGPVTPNSDEGGSSSSFSI